MQQMWVSMLLNRDERGKAGGYAMECYGGIENFHFQLQLMSADTVCQSNSFIILYANKKAEEHENS